MCDDAFLPGIGIISKATSGLLNTIVEGVVELRVGGMLGEIAASK